MVSWTSTMGTNSLRGGAGDRFEIDWPKAAKSKGIVLRGNAHAFMCEVEKSTSQSRTRRWVSRTGLGLARKDKSGQLPCSGRAGRNTAWLSSGVFRNGIQTVRNGWGEGLTLLKTGRHGWFGEQEQQQQHILIINCWDEELKTKILKLPF